MESSTFQVVIPAWRILLLVAMLLFPLLYPLIVARGVALKSILVNYSWCLLSFIAFSALTYGFGLLQGVVSEGAYIFLTHPKGNFQSVLAWGFVGIAAFGILYFPLRFRSNLAKS